MVHLVGEAESTPPFAPVLLSVTDGLPPVFARQFLTPGPVRLEGVMHEVWHKPLLRPLFWLLGTLGVLVGKTGKDIPTTLVIEPAARGQLYRRTFRFQPPVELNSLNTYDPAKNCVMEWVGPAKALGMAWDVRFRPPATLLLVTSGWVLRLGRVHLRIPGWLWPWTLGRADAIQRANDHVADTVHIELVIRHGLLGKMFGFSGTFRVIRGQEPS
jgi:hypothetical protein